MMRIFWTNFHCPDPSVTVVITENENILAVGNDTLLTEKSSFDQVRDLEGAFLTPGFWDSHIHLLDYGRSFRRLRFDPQQNLDAILGQVRQRAQEEAPATWVLGGGWNRSALQAAPDRLLLDEVAPRHPVLLMSWDYHTAWLNTRAAEQLNLDPRQVQGDRDGHGRWTGILREGLAFWAQESAMAQDDSHLEEDLARGMMEAAHVGLTGVTTIENAQGLRMLETAPHLLRAGVFLRDVHAASLLDLGVRGGFGNPYLRILGIKWFLDGALGSGTAWMKQSYSDDPENFGMAPQAGQDLIAPARELSRQGLLLAVHAIGDRAVHQASLVLSQSQEVRTDGMRSRIEHGQLIDDEDLAIIQRSPIALSMQPVHLLVDRPIAEVKWGANRSRWAFRFRDAWDANIPLIFGSDAPVANPNPALGLWAAVHRGMPGDPPWHAEQALTPTEAIWAYTRAAAVVDGRPSGLLREGYWADFTLWREDPRAALIHRDFHGLSVVGTVVGGRRIW
ncbi:amidohydrolase [Sulfobacillus harzensis]|uniref:Amidohydrolase n=1 Tax=Sulfobacillus harzensis TaxID=2729629 RepID=A0A7Y0L5R8_9FIRM|nr:amidohydrolase [Sulfobacillus harzensis]NMP23246.1 amidohydrolase [Sulfobacillus harzensis]